MGGLVRVGQQGQGGRKVHSKVGFDWCTYMYVYIGCMMEWLLLCECMYM